MVGRSAGKWRSCGPFPTRSRASARPGQVFGPGASGAEWPRAFPPPLPPQQINTRGRRGGRKVLTNGQMSLPGASTRRGHCWRWPARRAGAAAAAQPSAMRWPLPSLQRGHSTADGDWGPARVGPAEQEEAKEPGLWREQVGRSPPFLSRVTPPYIWDVTIFLSRGPETL